MASVLGAMLDELMGKNRNANPEDRARETTFNDPDVCKYFLVGFCPHEMFVNTKADLARCTTRNLESNIKIVPNSKLGYEEDFLSFLQKMHSDMERKIKRNKERLALTQPDGQPTDSNKERLEEKIKQLNDKINEYLAKAEQLGALGKVDESVEATRVADRYKMEKEQARKTLAALSGGLEEVKPMEVCEICGCFLIVGDAQQRIEEHMTGKQHMGYAKIKATIDELQRRKEEIRDQENERRKAEREASKTSDDRHRRSDRDRDEKRRRSKDRDRDRTEKRRSKSKERERSSTSRRSHRSRSRDRDRRLHRRGSRSKSRERHSSSRHSSSHRQDSSRKRRGEKEEASSRDSKRSRRRSGSKGREKEEKMANGEVKGAKEKEGTPEGELSAGAEESNSLVPAVGGGVVAESVEPNESKIESSAHEED